MTAHEVAHIDRHDPIWITFAELVASCGAFQPLSAVVAKSLRRDAEFACDEAAARKTNDATTLVEVLSTIVTRYDGDATAAVGYAGSPIVGRAERLLALKLTSASGRAPRIVMSVLVLALWLPLFRRQSPSPRGSVRSKSMYLVRSASR